MPITIIAEAGVNHNGSLEMAAINLFCEGISWRFKNLIAFLEYEI